MFRPFPIFLASFHLAAFLSLAELSFLPSMGKKTASPPVGMYQPEHAPSAAYYKQRTVGLAIQGPYLHHINELGSLATVDRLSGKELRHQKEWSTLTDLVALDDRRLLLLNQKHSEALLIQAENRDFQWEILQRLALPEHPVAVELSPDRKTAAVASLWPRQLSLIDIGDELRIRAVIDLPFAPLRMAFEDSGKRLVLLDAFGGGIGIVDPDAAVLKGWRHITDGHNQRGIWVEDGRVYSAQQILNEQLPTTRDLVFWGQVIGNVVRSIDLDYLESGQGEAVRRWRLYPLGESKNAAGDPGAMYRCADGTWLVCLSGVNEVAVGRNWGNLLRIPVGANPVDLVVDEHARLAYVGNRLDHRISVISLETKSVVKQIQSRWEVEPESGETKGERLFYDARLSLDGWFSCHSCHPNGHTNGRLVDTFGDGTTGTPKRVLSLLGAGHTGPWSWSGDRKDLKDQVHQSLLSTMQGKESGKATPDNAELITAYLQTLRPVHSPEQLRDTLDREAEKRGREVFRKLKCAACHDGWALTSTRRFDVGLSDEAGLSDYNPPALRGLGQLPRFLHDNSAANLREVFTVHRHPEGQRIEDGQLEDLLVFLLSL